MIRFTIKSLMFLTAIVATYALVWVSAMNGSTWPLLMGLVSLGCLIIGKVYCAERAMMNERTDGAKRLD